MIKNLLRMKKNLVCISQSISFVTDTFLYMLLITLPAALLFAATATYVCYAGISGISGIVGLACMFVSFLLLQGVVFRLWDVRQRGIEVRAQKFRSVYKAGLGNAVSALNPVNWYRCGAIGVRHFSDFLALSLCLLIFYGVIFFVLSTPLLSIGVIRYAVKESMAAGDVVTLPGGIDAKLCMVLLIVNYVIAVVSMACLLPFSLLWQKYLKDGKE